MTTTDSLVIGLDDPTLTKFFAGKAPGDKIEVELSVGGQELTAEGQVESVDEKMAIMNLTKFIVSGEETPVLEPTEKPLEAETQWMEKRVNEED